ncbi:ABC transporter ATP-binding protein [bacterium]|nr:ABC transporter ATP-binding protein [bacterium]
MFEIRSLHAGYSGVEVLHGINLVVEKEETVCVLGANGAGKTTLLLAISGIVPIIRGEIEFEEIPLQGLPPAAIVKNGIAHVPEGRRVFEDLTVAENLALAMRRRVSSLTRVEKVEKVLDLFPILRERYNTWASLLSGGEQQMLAIARALVSEPKLLLLDEPFLGLSPKVSDEIAKVIHRISHEGTTVLLVEQNTDRAIELANRAYVMETGRIVLNGSPEAVLHDPRFIEAYLGSDLATNRSSVNEEPKVNT